ncbi:YcaO-like family protein [Roseibium sp. MMSF_3412]|uniref:YcaO-like family protein n=1 Tax=Roseibium sp. MMSF_3412 TaxID=3046712 RepID=UPI00273D65F1|nr:YcaO-like family protein [Roseibium sp. MMSF_3412]
MTTPEGSRARGMSRLYGADAFLNRLQKHLGSFGITRLADITGLDRVGIPVVQAVRPLARSNAVNQGKGFTIAEAAVSAIVEALETAAAENVTADAEDTIPAGSVYGSVAAEKLAHHLLPDLPEDWIGAPLPFLTGTDLVNGAPTRVPAALVSTDFTPGSPHAASPFVRTTTGLGGGATRCEALMQGLFETLERLGTARAMGIHGFFEKQRLKVETLADEKLNSLVDHLQRSGLLCAIYDCPRAGGLPVIWARLLDEQNTATTLPFHADGFACRMTYAEAAIAALLEAVQTRASVIAGGREDITRQFYPKRIDQELVDFERAQMRKISGRAAPEIDTPPEAEPEALARRIQSEGFQAIAVPLLADSDIPLHVARIVTLARGETDP